MPPFISWRRVWRADTAPTASCTMSDWNNPFATLATKWHEVPASEQGRTSTITLLQETDDALLAFWNEQLLDLRTPQQGYARDWLITVYADTFRGRRAIEIGPGLGLQGISFLQCGAEIMFVDVAQSNLDLITRLCRLKGLTRFSTHHLRAFADLNRLDGEFDIVFAHGSLHHAPAAIIKPEFDALASRLKIGGRWLMLAYPKARWEREGRLDFAKWGKMTDGDATPWAEWYDLPKLLEQLKPQSFQPLMAFDFHNSDFNWFDLRKI